MQKLNKNFRTSLFLLLVFFLTQSVWSGELMTVEARLKLIPPEKLETIKILFNDLFKRSEFSYVLYGNKPVSLIDYYKTSLNENSSIKNYCETLFEKRKSTDFYLRGWINWGKYKYLFVIENYILTSSKFHYSEDSIIVILIGKNEFIKKVNEHIKIFQEILGKNVTHLQLLEQIDNGTDFFDVIAHDQELLGMLLGFGNHNAHLFKQKEEMITLAENRELLLQTSSSIPSVSLDVQLAAISDLMQFFNEPVDPPMAMCFPSFLADLKHPETVALRAKYHKERKEISPRLNAPNWFENILLELEK